MRSAAETEIGPDMGDGVGDGGTYPGVGLGLADAASCPTAVLRPHHCGSATVAVRSHPLASRALVITEVTWPHTNVTNAELARPPPAAHALPPVNDMPIYCPLLTAQLEKEPKLVLVILFAALSSVTLPNGTIERNRPWPPRPAPAIPNDTSGTGVAAPFEALRRTAATERGPEAGVADALAVIDEKLVGDGLGERLAAKAAEL